ncbi:TonB family protein [Prevotella sp. E15-22]|uniref:energy transducer TonB n=1 Tax=Prevotella sp. E15-22 TaxID=2937774 RepID=UPI00205413CD|nr:TonB family protein [Prevotella sp. E15-22]UPS44827.1 TonB family protein [Prevotella sp. E15-22]
MKTMLMSLLICSACCAQHVKLRPSFPGGYKALQEFIEKEKKHPDEALKKREAGAVYVVFTVDTLGNIVRPRVATSVSPSLDREALRIVRKMPKWIPAKEGNKKINMDFTVIIRFYAPPDPDEIIFKLDCGLPKELEAPADINKIYDVVDTYPSFQGDLMTYLYNETRYPAIAEGTGAGGRAIVTFVVERDGSISHIKIARSLASRFAIPIIDSMTAEYRQKAKAHNRALQAMDEEAVRVIKAMPKWNPGKYHDTVVRVSFVLDVPFKPHMNSHNTK